MPHNAPPFQPLLDNLDQAPRDLLTGGVLLLLCCAQCTQDSDVEDFANSILEKLENGHVYQEMGDHSWRAYTAPDTQCGSHRHYTSDPGNGIVVNSSLFFDYADSMATAALLVCAVAHEQWHSKLLVNSQSLIDGGWDDPCNLYENEICVHDYEADQLNCIMSCACLAGMTGGGQSNLADRLDDIARSRQYWSERYEDC